MDCSVTDCDRSVYAKRLCHPHYERLRKKGVLGGPIHSRAESGALPAFIDAALVSDTDDCIFWPHNTSSGYGYVQVGKKRRRVHIVVCEMAHDAKPPDKDVAAHRCGKPLCINPRHLYWATHAENMADKVEHGTAAHRGERSRWAKLTEAQAREIKVALAAKETHRSIAARYGVSTSAVDLISSGRNWAWL